MRDLDLCFAPVTDLLPRLRERSLSPVEWVESCLARIEEVNPTLNCFCFTYPEEAIDKARAAERRLAAGKDTPPLTGVPIAFKDLTPTKGKTTTLGSYVYEHWVPDESSVIVERFEAAGAIIVGKTTTPEFASDGFTYSPLWGHTRNPWDTERTPGGSSGGSGAAVAAGCVPWAEGCDMGGSVRIPAALCGLVGLKPSLGRIPMDLIPSTFDNISHFGPLTRCIDDAALFMRFAQGPHDRDIQSLVTTQEFRVPVTCDPRTLKLALSIDLGHMSVDDVVEESVRGAAASLRKAGAAVDEIELGWPGALEDAAIEHWRVYMAAFFGQHLDQWRDKMDPNVVRLIEEGRRMSAPDYKRMEVLRSQAWQALAPVLQRYDALLCPVVTMLAPKLGSNYLDLIGTTADGKYRGMDMTAAFNLVGQCPALSVPIGFSAEGLPLALQIVGPRFDDEKVLRIGKAVESVLGGWGRRPSL